MDTKEINNYFGKYKKFKGTYALDQIKPNLNSGEGIVCNTDPMNEPGEHWIAIYKNNKNISIYFDSFGLPPLHDEILKYLNEISPNGYYHNTVTFQSIYQDTCGNYCIYFLSCMFRCDDYKKFCKIFKFSPHFNDVVAKIIYKIQDIE